MPRKYWYIILIYIGMQFSSIITVPLLDIIKIDQTTLVASWSVFSFAVALIIILYLLRGEMNHALNEDRIEGAAIGSIVTWSIIGVVMAFVAQSIAVTLETYVFGIKPGSENTMNIMNIARAVPIFIIVVTIIAPILEEIIFRKIIFGSIYKRTNLIIGALGSAFIFALVHNDFAHILTYTAMGLVFAYLYVKTKRIIVPIITHMAMNSITVLAQYNTDPEEMEKMLDKVNQLQQMIFFGG
ncbi:CPBP family intramembrane glutamic endopeptidase [Aquibacillus salsiterrae]|uniref:CPBP family intramembrane metalloprotease n=1 Tax=Aquibacillus salsiterrae TaxID=2950439 RepID=A0A9X4AHR2_9BACI|nr:type II CAAX endopeptidase family protein [Aquibacillus salsiterrae]MDC3418600.1 CPBP family intramembrane metalloprotease [Aquibacillus salsiterrae]